MKARSSLVLFRYIGNLPVILSMCEVIMSGAAMSSLNVYFNSEEHMLSLNPFMLTS